VRILLVNAFHYLRGGVERTYLDESRWLSAAGHEVAHLAIQDPRNVASPGASHFAPAAEFGEAAPAARQIVQIPRVIWSAAAERAMDALLGEFHPDIAHLHAPSRYLTPSILRPLERERVPTVMTLHDFKPWCTNRILFAHGEPCERCKGGHHWHALATSCVQDSRAKSAVGMIEAYVHQSAGAYRHVKLWIAPSRFVYDKAVEFGVLPAALRVLPHGVEPPPADPELGTFAPEEEPGPARAGTCSSGSGAPYALFTGRLSIEKGVRLLPEIARAIAPTRLVVAGEGPLAGVLADARERAPNLEPLGHVDDDELAAYRRSAAAVVVPSLFYEHFCYVAAEALLDERPVVAARIGAIPELIEHEVTGLLVRPGDAGAIAAALRRALDDAAALRWAQAGARRVREKSNPAAHLAGLLNIYRETIGRN